ncbi:hypothetical protein D031_0768B, partial [Vibrio parahaemolyticus VP-48]
QIGLLTVFRIFIEVMR